MAIIAVCSACGNAYEVSDLLVGKSIKCNKCDAMIFVRSSNEDLRPRNAIESVPRAIKSIRDEDEEEDNPRRRRRPGRRRDYDEDGPSFRCPFCKSRWPPRRKSKVSNGGWVMFCVLLILCFPIFWIPLLLMKEDDTFCSNCGVKIG